MRPARLVAALASAALLVPLLAGAAAPGAKAPPPTLELSSTVLVPGSSVAIHGTHWPEGTTLQAVLCGANAVDGSVDCVGRAAVTMTPGPTQVVDGTLQVFVPPRPCPCVVLVSGLSSSISRRIPVQVAGTATAPPETASPLAKPPTLTVDAEVSGGTTLASLFGGPAERTVEVRIHNAGSVDVAHPVLTLSWGRSGSPDHLIRTPRLGPIAGGATRTVEVPFDLDALSVGNYEVAGRITGASKPVALHASTSTWPWGLFVIALVLLQLILLGIRNRVRRRLARKQVEARIAAAQAAASADALGTDPPDAGELPTQEVPVVRGGALDDPARNDEPRARPPEPICWRAPATSDRATVPLLRWVSPEPDVGESTP
ncbi:MAG TPA: hypothetical protein VFW97_09495 [Acidimicrobiia bacterium]|jgi:hypothetical protein|nr:hypothetical protein [Acidimicrobiia bacterium]